jgi:hypothetical protein
MRDLGGWPSESPLRHGLHLIGPIKLRYLYQAAGKRVMLAGYIGGRHTICLNYGSIRYTLSVLESVFSGIKIHNSNKVLP